MNLATPKQLLKRLKELKKDNGLRVKKHETQSIQLVSRYSPTHGFYLPFSLFYKVMDSITRTNLDHFSISLPEPNRVTICARGADIDITYNLFGILDQDLTLPSLKLNIDR